MLVFGARGEPEKEHGGGERQGADVRELPVEGDAALAGGADLLAEQAAARLVDLGRPRSPASRQGIIDYRGALWLSSATSEGAFFRAGCADARAKFARNLPPARAARVVCSPRANARSA